MQPDLYSAARWIVGSAIAFALLVVSVNPLSTFITSTFPDNYQWRADRAIQYGSVESVRSIAKEAVARQYYDFGAQSLLASIYLKENNTTAALQLLQSSIDKARAISGRRVYSESYNLPATVELYARALYGPSVYASEMQRWWHDLETLHTPLSGSEVRQKPAPYVSADLTNTIQWLPLDQITTHSGIQILESGSLRFDNNGSVAANFPDTSDLISRVVLEVRGPKVMGIGGILRVSCDGKVLADIYTDSTTPRLVDLPIVKSNTSGTLELTLEFLNDEFDPFTSTDRYVELLRLGYVNPNP